MLLGAKDKRVPMSQGMNYVRGLQDRGVDTRMIVFPDCQHGITAEPRAEHEALMATMAWLTQHIGAQ